MKPTYHCPDKNERKGDPHFKLECVIVCNDYSDFLKCTLPHNKQFFDRVVVVTSPDDLATQRVCEFYHVQCVKSARCNPAPGSWCKGAGINDGLAVLDGDGWILHLDADIWLPPQTRNLLQLANLDKRMLYGIDRFNVRGWESWQKFLQGTPLQQENHVYIHLNKAGFPMGTRIMQPHMAGYTPIGFFQLWHPSQSNVVRYPEGKITYAHEDVQFANFWARAQRSFIPEIVGYHLESEDAGFGTNWNGRKSAPFEPKPTRKWYHRITKFFGGK